MWGISNVDTSKWPHKTCSKEQSDRWHHYPAVYWPEGCTLNHRQRCVQLGQYWLSSGYLTVCYWKSAIFNFFVGKSSVNNIINFPYSKLCSWQTLGRLAVPIACFLLVFLSYFALDLEVCHVSLILCNQKWSGVFGVGVFGGGLGEALDVPLLTCIAILRHSWCYTLKVFLAISTRSWCYALGFFLAVTQISVRAWRLRLVASACQSMSIPPWKKMASRVRRFQGYGVPVRLETKSWTRISLRLPLWFFGGHLEVLPTMGAPLNRPSIVGFSIINHPFWDTLILRKPPFKISCKFDGEFHVNSIKKRH